MAAAPFEHIRVERPAAGVVLLTLDRPQRMNATNAVLHRELALLPRWIDDDASSRVAVITGSGNAFSAGGDLDELAQGVDDFDGKLQMMRETLAIVGGLVDCRKPVISAINGAAAGAGLAVALLADISVMNEDAVLCDGHTRIGLVAGDHAALIWPLLCGLAKAKLHLLTCSRIGGREAERIGLVSEAVPREQVLTRALELAGRLAAQPPLALELSKRALNHWLRMAMPTFESSLGYEMLTSFSPEHAAQMQALVAARGARA